MVKFTIGLIITLFATPAYAAQVTKDDINQMIERMQTVMNQRTNEGLDKYFSFYADSEAHFLMTSYLVDAKDPTKILAQETLDMNRTQYVDYLKTVIKPPAKYVYQATVNSIKMDDAKSQALVSYSTSEYALNTLIDTTYNKMGEEVSLISANCNMIADYSGSDLVILSNNCEEKIIKKKS